jgi:hypothetical protein
VEGEKERYEIMNTREEVIMRNNIILESRDKQGGPEMTCFMKYSMRSLVLEPISQDTDVKFLSNLEPQSSTLETLISQDTAGVYLRAELGTGV